MQGRDNLSVGGQHAREYLIAELKQLGVKPLSDDWEQPFAQGSNVVGVIAGSDPALADQHVILSAHYDHLGKRGNPNSQCLASSTDPGDTICNGASDNASGCAAVLAIVRAIKQGKVGLKRSLVVAFWDAEEDGLLGSKHFVDSAVLPAANVSTMINLDTLASELFSGYTAFFALGVEHSDQLRQLIAASPLPESITVHPVSEFFSGGGSAGRGDHVSFRAAQVPFVWFSSGASARYHSPDDEVDEVDTELLSQMAQLIMLTTAGIANAPQRPSFIKAPRPHLDDAKAMIEIGEFIQSNPSATGLDDSMLALLDGFLQKLRDYIANPPTTQAEWAGYQSFVKSIITMVYAAMGR